MGHLTLTTPLSWKIFHRRVGLAMVSQGTKFEVSRFIHYEAMNGSTKCIKMGWFGMVSGHSRSWTMPPFEFDRAHTTLYWTLIETMRLSFSPSVRCRCWLGDRKGIRPVKNRVVGYWHGYLSGARCRLAYGPAHATATHCLLLQ